MPNDSSSQNDFNYDGIDITRKVTPDVDNINVIIKLFKDSSPKEYTVSEKLSKIIKIQQGSLLKINNAVWMYIKLNRLQDRDKIKTGGKWSETKNFDAFIQFWINFTSDINDWVLLWKNKQWISLSPDKAVYSLWNFEIGLKEIFGKDVIEFHKLTSLIRPHLKAVEPICINFTISKTDPQTKTINVPVEIASKYRKDVENFLVENISLFDPHKAMHGNCELEFDLATLENLEADKIDKNIAESLGRSLKTAAYAYKFFEEYAQNPKIKIQNYMIEQKR